MQIIDWMHKLHINPQGKKDVFQIPVWTKKKK